MMNDPAFQPDPERPPQSSGKTDVQVVEEVTRLISRFQEDVFRRMDTSDHARFEQLSEFRTRMDSRFDVRDREFDDLASRFDAFTARVEERLVPFAELPARVERVETAVDHLEQQQIGLTARLDAAMDPETEGATLAQKAMQGQITALRQEMQTGFWRVFWWLFACGVVVFLLLLGAVVAINHYYYVLQMSG